jgi:hypothetical protein
MHDAALIASRVVKRSGKRRNKPPQREGERT